MFKKNQEVTVIALWSQGCRDSKIGTQVQFSVEHLVVHSCGKKQMILRTEAGEVYKGRLYLPTTEQYSDGLVLDRVTTEEALRIADERAAAYCEKQVARLNVILEKTEGKYGSAYTDKLTKDRDHYAAKPVAPAALYADLVAVVRSK